METKNFLTVLEKIKDKSHQDYDILVVMLKSFAAKHDISADEEHPPKPPIHS